MSYDIIKSISIKKGRVFINAASSNVYPKHYYNSQCPSLTRILAEQGRGELDKTLFNEFRVGNFHGKSTLYAKAIIWQAASDDRADILDEQLLGLFTKAWNGKGRCHAVYLGVFTIIKVTSKSFRYSRDRVIPKIFKNRAQAEYYLGHYDDVSFVDSEMSKAA